MVGVVDKPINRDFQESLLLVQSSNLWFAIKPPYIANIISPHPTLHFNIRIAFFVTRGFSIGFEYDNIYILSRGPGLVKWGILG